MPPPTAGNALRGASTAADGVGPVDGQWSEHPNAQGGEGLGLIVIAGVSLAHAGMDYEEECLVNKIYSWHPGPSPVRLVWSTAGYLLPSPCKLPIADAGSSAILCRLWSTGGYVSLCRLLKSAMKKGAVTWVSLMWN